MSMPCGPPLTTVTRRDALVSAVLLVTVLVLYWPVRHFGYVRLDDPILIFENPHAADGLTRQSARWAVTSLVTSNYMPVSVLSLLADVSIWGLNPGPIHLENAIFHGISTFGWLWFLGTLLPMIGFVQTGMSAMADRYTYLPYVGLSVAIIWWTGDAWETAIAKRPALRQPGATVVCGLMLLACLVDARRQLRHWRTSLALYSHASEFEPDDAGINGAMGTEYRLAGRPDLAVQYHGKSLAENPGNGDTETNLGGLLMRIDPKQALPHYEAAACNQSTNPSHGWNLSNCESYLGLNQRASASFRRALQLDPNYEPARQSLRSLPPGS